MNGGIISYLLYMMLDIEIDMLCFLAALPFAQSHPTSGAQAQNPAVQEYIFSTPAYHPYNKAIEKICR